MVRSNLRIFMAKARIKTLRELGRRAGLSWKILSYLDNDENIDTIQLGNLLKVCFALNCKLEDLLEIHYEKLN